MKQIAYEAGQEHIPAELLSNTGDQKTFESVSELMSDNGEYSPTVIINGVIAGGISNMAASGSDNVIDITNVIVNLNGVPEVSVSAVVDEAVTRGADAAHQYMINSICVDSAGAWSVEVGTGAASAFMTVRGSAGGPPFIPIDAIEVNQIRMKSSVSGPITKNEIFKVEGTHREMANFPSPTIKFFRESDGVLGLAGIDFANALPKIHTGALPKRVYIEYYIPDFAIVQHSRDFSKPGNTASITSESFYDGTKGDKSNSLGQGGFSFSPVDGITDAIFKRIDQKVFLKFWYDKNKAPYVLCQGYLNEDTPFPAEGVLITAITISASEPAVRITA